MIRGAIELLTSEVAEGWIYVEEGNIRQRAILAFLGTECVGSGRVTIFRPDLADAGLGDGHLGFSFPVTVPKDRVKSVVVKIEGSDAVILQPGASVESVRSRISELDRQQLMTHLARIRWSLKHGRLGQADFDFLRTVWTFGIYERGLVRRNSADEKEVIGEWEKIARELFEVYLGLEVETVRTRLGAPSAFKLALTRLADDAELLTVVALHSEGRSVLRVSEGSHVKDSANAVDTDRAARPVEYILSAENLVMMDSRLTVDLWLAEGASIDLAVARIPRLEHPS